MKKINRKLLHESFMQGTDLEKEVINHLFYRYGDYNDIRVCIEEILEHGCISGCVSSLIYYHDTTKFYEKHKNEINERVYQLFADYGSYDPSAMFMKWDKQDPLCLEPHNQCILAWFGFEETLRDLYYKWEEETK